MCGIYGSSRLYNDDQIRSKLKRTEFRGPDQHGFERYVVNDNTLILGHNRLSIVDLDVRSNQPFTYADYVHLVFNGEIFNFKTLKEELKKLGYKFRTTSDTEVICAAYLHYGEDCVNHFNGQFAFVILDVKKNVLFGARDRMGQKPFYYYHKGKEIEFSSQISSIQMYREDLTISSKAINYYLSWGNVPDPFSIFNDIHKLKAGHRFTFDLNSGEMNIDQYWDIDYEGKTHFEGSFDDAKRHLDELLTDAVEMRMFADVPVGVFLSGGIDSSLISAVATKNASEKVKTFSVKFNEEGFNESIYAGQVADHLSTDHHVIECNYNEGIDLIDNFSYYYDEPFADSSAIPSMLLSKYTKKQVTVALSGDSGDENFIGYHRYDWIRRGEMAMKIPRPLRLLGAGLLELSPNYKFKIIANVLKLRNTNEAYLFAMTGTDSTWFDFKDYLNIEERKYLEHNNKHLFERVSDFDLKTYLNWDINTKVDRASMAYSLEVRAPLMDYRIVEFARSLPTEYKYDKQVMKRLLKSLLYDYVPKDIFDRPKAGFTMPFAHWFRHELKDYVLDELNEESLANIPGIKVDVVMAKIQEHLNNKWNRYPLIWKLLVLKQWLTKNGEGLSYN